MTGNDSQTDAVLAAQSVPVFAKLLQHPKMNIVKEAAWTVSNITAGNSNQIQIVMDAGVLQPLIDILVKGDFKAQKEAAWAITNLTSGGTVPQIVQLCGEGVLKPFCDLLAAKDDKTVGVVLDGVSNILATAEKLSEVDKVIINNLNSSESRLASKTSSSRHNLGGNDGRGMRGTRQDRAATGSRERSKYLLFYVK